MARTKQDLRRRRILADIRELRGLDREHHFASGGTLEAWIGRHFVALDRRREDDRRRCRRPVEDE